MGRIVERARCGLSEADQLTKKQRRKLASELATEVANFRILFNPWLKQAGSPSEIRRELLKVASELTDDFWKVESNLDGPAADNGNDLDLYLSHHRAIESVLLRLPEVIDKIGAQAIAIIAAPPVITRPNEQGAARKFFLMSTTDAFVILTGKPLRTLVLEMASVFYDCTALTAAEVGQLAPLSKRTKRKPRVSKRVK